MGWVFRDRGRCRGASGARGGGLHAADPEIDQLRENLFLRRVPEAVWALLACPCHTGPPVHATQSTGWVVDRDEVTSAAEKACRGRRGGGRRGRGAASPPPVCALLVRVVRRALGRWS